MQKNKAKKTVIKETQIIESQLGKPTSNIYLQSLKIIFWFSTGAILGFFLLICIVYVSFQKLYENRIYPGVIINGVSFSGKTINDVKSYFNTKNKILW